MAEQIDIDMVQDRGELLLLQSPRHLPYAFQAGGHARPARCPVRAVLIRVLLGPRPSLHRLRTRSRRLVRRLRRYYGRV
jgi:hypothetical protein